MNNSPPLNVRIETLSIEAASAREARALADALPAALERALIAAPRPAAARSAGVVEAEAIRAAAGAPGVPDLVARRVVEAIFSRGARP